MGKHESRRGQRGRAGSSRHESSRHESSHHESDHEEAQAAGHRHERLSRLLREELGAITRDELGDPRLDQVQITLVELSVDYRNARVLYVGPRGSSAEDRDRIERALAKATPFMRARLADSVDLKQVPALRFVWDRAAAERPEGFEPEIG